MEDKQKICDLLCEALKATCECSDLRKLHYIKEREEVEVEYDGRFRVNVACDSGIAMIRDILQALD